MSRWRAAEVSLRRPYPRESIDAALDNAREGGAGSDLRDAARKLMGRLQQFRGASADQQARAKDKVDQLRRELYGILAE